MNKYIALWLTGFCLLALTPAFAQKSDQLIVEGILKGASNQMVYFDRLVDKKVVSADSVMSDKKGRFKMETEMGSLNFCRISLNSKQFIPLIAQKGDRLKLMANASEIPSEFYMEGSEHATAISDFHNMDAGFTDCNKEARQNQEAAKTSGDPQKILIAQQEMEDFNLEYRAFILEFIETYAHTPVVLFALGKLRIEDDFEYFALACDALQEKYPDKEYTQQLVKMVQLVENRMQASVLVDQRTRVGTEAPEIVGLDTAYNEIRLSSLRGKVVLIDFWASWCRPCRIENPNLVKNYKKYKDAGFTVYSVSLDQNRSRWVSAIQQDELIWPNHVSDLKGWKSQLSKPYGVGSIPFTLLIDRKGKIMGKNLRGQALEKKLHETFGF